MDFPTATELNLWDVEIPEGMAISVFPPAQEHMMDPIWWDQAGRDPLDQKFILKMDAGPERTKKLKTIVIQYPRHGPKMYERCAKIGRGDLIRELLLLGADMKLPADNGDVQDSSDDTKEEIGDRGSGEEQDVENEQSDGGNVVEDSDAISAIDGAEEDPMAPIEPAIIAAAYYGHLDCIKILVEEGKVDVNTRHNDGGSALSHASAHGYIDIVRWLLSQGATLTFDRTAGKMDDVEAAVSSGNVKLLKVLLDAENVRIDKSNPRVEYLWLSTASGNVDMVRFVLEHFQNIPLPSDAVDLTLSDEQKQHIATSLSGAIAKNSLETIELLLSYLTERRSDGLFESYQLDEAIQKEVFEATEEAMKGPHDNAILFELVWESLLRPPQLQLDSNPRLRQQHHARVTRRLISACSIGCPNIVRLLCEKYGANVNHVSYKYYTTPLSMAGMNSFYPLQGRLETAKYLLARPDIDIHLATGEYSNGPTALALCILQAPECHEMLRLLLKHGGPLEKFDSEDADQLHLPEGSEGITVYLAASSRLTRFPVRVVSRERYDRKRENKNFTFVELFLTRADVEEIIPKLQFRHTDFDLKANDPKDRPIQESEKTDLEYVLRQRFENVNFGPIDGI